MIILNPVMAFIESVTPSFSGVMRVRKKKKAQKQMWKATRAFRVFLRKLFPERNLVLLIKV